jgi:hypothetical protein
MEVSMANGWTPERRTRQAALIRTWRPWEHSTGPVTAEGKARTARNGDKGGHRVKLRAALSLLRLALDDQREALAEWQP